jgi:chromate reductase
MKISKILLLALAIGSHALYAEAPSTEKKVLAVAGSTRDDSLNKKLVVEAANLARQAGARVTVVDLKDYSLPFYDGDLEAKSGMPQKAQELRQLMIQSDAIFIASPEYNGSLSAVLKNAIDWASRNEKGGPSREAFQGKKFAIMSVSPGQGGGVRGLAHLRTIIESVGGTLLPGQVVVKNGSTAFDESGQLVDQTVKLELQKLVQEALAN